MSTKTSIISSHKMILGNIENYSCDFTDVKYTSEKMVFKSGGCRIGSPFLDTIVSR